MVEEEEVLALHVEHQGLGVVGLVSEHARGEQAVEEEGGVRRLGGHPRDAADVDVRPRAIEELQVHVDGLVLPREPSREPMGHPVEAQGLEPLVSHGSADFVARKGGTSVSGSKRVAWTRAARAISAGSNPSATSNTWLSNRAFVPRLDLGDQAEDAHHVAAGSRRSRATTSSSWRYWSSDTPTQNSSGVASSLADDPAHDRSANREITHRGGPTKGL